MDDDDKLVPGWLETKAQGLANTVLPEKVKAEATAGWPNPDQATRRATSSPDPSSRPGRTEPRDRRASGAPDGQGVQSGRSGKDASPWSALRVASTWCSWMALCSKDSREPAM